MMEMVSSQPAVAAAPRHDQAIWLLSDGRSGSTWFSQLLNCRNQFHVEHEPIHRNFNPRLLDQPLMPFPDEGALNSHYLPLFEDMLAGRYVTHRFGEQDGGPAEGKKGLVIRDIHGLLIAPRVLAAFPQLRPAIIVRHPAEVATSKVALAEWDWFSETERFLEDPTVRRELTGLSHLIAAADTPYRRYVIHWAASHRFFFSTVSPRSLPIIRYPARRDEIIEGIRQVMARIGLNAPTHCAAFDAAWNTRSATEKPPCEQGLFRRAFTRERPSNRDLYFTEKVIDAFCLRWLVPWTAYVDAPAPQAILARTAPRGLIPSRSARAFGF